MLKLWTQEALPEELPLLGLLEPPERAARQVCLMQRIDIPEAGGFTKKQPVGMLDESALRERLGKQEAEESEEGCAGVLLPHGARGAIGQVRLCSGCYEYSLPVSALAAVDNKWATRGYLPLADGRYVIVAGKRHIAAKILRCLLLVGVAAAAYYIHANGWEAVRQALTAWLAALT